MWKNSSKNVESDNTKILYETLLDFFQRNGTYCLNKPRNIIIINTLIDKIIDTILHYGVWRRVVCETGPKSCAKYRCFHFWGRNLDRIGMNII